MFIRLESIIDLKSPHLVKGEVSASRMFANHSMSRSGTAVRQETSISMILLSRTDKGCY